MRRSKRKLPKINRNSQRRWSIRSRSTRSKAIKVIITVGGFIIIGIVLFFTVLYLLDFIF